MKVVLQDMKGSAESRGVPSSDDIQNTPEDPVLDSSSVSVSSDKDRKITREDIEIVQNLVERCLQLYMNRDEVMNTLLYRARIEPGFTALVWQKLEEENVDFFKAYNARLMLKKQIILFNQLLEQQYNLMNYQMHPKDPLGTMQNGAASLDPTECAVSDVSMGYPVNQYPPVPASGNISTCVANGTPAPGDFHPLTINSSDFTTIDISGLSMGMSTLDPVFSTLMASSEGFPMGSDTGNSKQSLQTLSHMPWNPSFPHLAADLTNMEVEEFFADNVPEPDFPSEEDKS